MGRPGGTDRIETQEPKDGDFVAYVEQLQKESAARVLGAHHSVNQLDKTATGASKPDSHFFAGRKPADFRPASASREALTQIATASASRLLSATIAIVIGVLLAFYWLFASASIVLLAVGIALVFWGIQRVKRAVQRISPQQRQQAQAAVSKVFAPPAKAK
ncbi:MAG: hypothetical protein ACRECQ_06215 [Burkholderiaceae bacterium]